jgi:hypothetical protein
METKDLSSKPFGFAIRQQVPSASFPARYAARKEA